MYIWSLCSMCMSDLLSLCECGLWNHTGDHIIITVVYHDLKRILEIYYMYQWDLSVISHKRYLSFYFWKGPPCLDRENCCKYYTCMHASKHTYIHMHEICSQWVHTYHSTMELYFLYLFIWMYAADFGSTPLWYHQSYPAGEKFERLSWSTSSCPCQSGGILFSFSPRFCQLFHCGNVLSGAKSLACDLRYKICNTKLDLNANRKNMPIYTRDCLPMDWS